MKRTPETVGTGGGNYAVLLNINARGVNRKVRTALSHMMPTTDLFISSTPSEADTYAAQIIRRRYDGVFSGGGDGSLVMLINMLWKHVMAQNSLKSPGDPPYAFPMLGILKLGTGNGWAGVVGSKKGMNQLERAISGAAMKAMPFDLIESEGSRFHFSGMGWDAAILNDYNAFKGLGDRYPAIKKHITGLPGYLASILFNTIPKEGVKQLIPSFRVKVKIANLGKSVFRIEGGGRPVPARFGRGDIIFRGEINIVGVATTPYYGFSMKAFPYAMTMPGMMNLRIVQAGIPELLLNAGRIWDGVYGGPHFHDFLVSDVEIMTSSPMPMHIGGDAKGLRESMRYRVVPEAVRVLDFNA